MLATWLYTAPHTARPCSNGASVPPRVGAQGGRWHGPETAAQLRAGGTWPNRTHVGARRRARSSPATWPGPKPSRDRPGWKRTGHGAARRARSREDLVRLHVSGTGPRSRQPGASRVSLRCRGQPRRVPVVERSTKTSRSVWQLAPLPACRSTRDEYSALVTKFRRHRTHMSARISLAAALRAGWALQ
jgi:hypothetical protein